MSPSSGHGEVLNGIETTVVVECDGKTHKVVTKDNTIERALEESPCALEEFDITDPSRDARISGGTVEVNVIRALPVTIVDNGNKDFYKSGYITSDDILNQLNINVFPEDIVETDLILTDFIENGFGQMINIKRAPVFSLNADGKTKNIRSWEKTIIEVLKDKKIPLGPKDEVSPSKNSLAKDGQTITITRINEVETTATEAIPFQTITKKDYYLHQGNSRIEQAGVAGLTEKTYRVIYRNGVVHDKIFISEKVKSSPQTKIIVKGVKPYNHGDLWDIMVVAGQKYGVDPSEMFSVMMCESGGNNYLGTYSGIFQWDGSFSSYAARAGYSGANILNVKAQIYATALRVSESGWSAWGCKP